MRDFIMATCTAIRAVSQKQPLRLPMASEVTFDLGNELRDLDYPCSSAFMVPKCFCEPFIPRKKGRKKGRKEGQNGHVDLRARTSPQVTNHQKEAAFALSGEIEIPGEKHLENIIAGISKGK